MVNTYAKKTKIGVPVSLRGKEETFYKIQKFVYYFIVVVVIVGCCGKVK